MKIFLATSFSGQMDDNGDILPDYRKFVEDVIVALRKSGAEIFCAAEHEGWKYFNATAKDGVKKDLVEIDKADTLLALLHSKMSGGIHVEIGYALGKGKRVVLVPEDDNALRYFNRGLVDLNRVERVDYSNPVQLAKAVIEKT